MALCATGAMGLRRSCRFRPLTYLPVLTHAEREHVFFKTFDDMEGSNLKGTRGVQKRGRKKGNARDSSGS